MMIGLPLYHEKSELRHQSGYYPNLSSEQQKAYEQLQNLLHENNIQLDDTDGEIPYFKLLRFLRARSFKVNKTFDMLKAEYEWRISTNMKSLRQQSCQEVLNCDLKTVFSYYPTWIQGFDFQNRPVAWRCFGKFEIWSILKHTTMDRLLKFHAWEIEQAVRVMQNKSKETGTNIETFVIVIDAAGWYYPIINKNT